MERIKREALTFLVIDAAVWIVAILGFLFHWVVGVVFVLTALFATIVGIGALWEISEEMKYRQRALGGNDEW